MMLGSSNVCRAYEVFSWQVWSQGMRKTVSEAVFRKFTSILLLSGLTGEASCYRQDLKLFMLPFKQDFQFQDRFRQKSLCLTPGVDISHCSNPSD